MVLVDCVDSRRALHLVEELAVGVRTEQGLSDAGERVLLEQPQPLVKGVVDFDLALAAYDDDASRTIRRRSGKSALY